MVSGRTTTKPKTKLKSHSRQPVESTEPGLCGSGAYTNHYTHGVGVRLRFVDINKCLQ